MRTVAAPASPLVSVIIPTHNYGHFIGQTLESVRAQTYQNWECLVVDDGLTDETHEVVERFVQRDCRIKYFHQPNRQQAAARNNGLRNSQGTYLQFLDADDLLENLKLERQVEYLEEHPQVDIVYGSVRYFPTENTAERLFSMLPENKPWMPETSGCGRVILMELAKRNIFTVNSALIRRSAIDDIGLFDESLPPLEDWDFFLRCAAQGKCFQFENAEGTLALVRCHPTSASRNRPRLLEMELRLRSKVGASVEDAEIRQINQELIAQGWRLVGVFEIANGEWWRGFIQLLQTSAQSRRLRWRAKWLLCALISPFVSGSTLIRFSTSSVSGWLAKVWQKSKGVASGTPDAAAQRRRAP